MIAIDPGAKGGIAVQTDDGRVFTHKMPDTIRDMFDLLQSLSCQALHTNTAFLEEVGGYAGGKGAPGSAMFNFGQGYGRLEMGLVANDFKLEKVRPQKWQKALSLGTSGGLTKTAWKNKLKGKAQELFPQIKVTLETADALLILHAGLKGLI